MFLSIKHADLIIDGEILCGYTQQPPLAYKLGIIGFLVWMRKYDAQHGERQFPLKEECIPFIHTSSLSI